MSKLLNREPTTAMIDAGCAQLGDDLPEFAASMWMRMHDAAPDLGQGEAVAFVDACGNQGGKRILSFRDDWLKAARGGTPLYAHPRPEQSAADEIKRLRTALRFYANGEHYSVGEGEKFDTVSGEPDNWLCSGVENSETMIETGQVAASALRGVLVDWVDGGEDETPQPIAGEVSCLDQVAPQPDQSARIKELEEALRQIRSMASGPIARTYPAGIDDKILTITGKALNLPERAN